MHSFLFYLLEVVSCQAVFCLLYLILFRNISFFQLNRFYLLVATLLSFIIPILSIPFWQTSNRASYPDFSQSLQNLSSSIGSSEVVTSQNSFIDIGLIFNIVFLIYCIGFAWRLLRLIGGLVKVWKLVKNHEVQDYDGIKAIHIRKGPAFFAFLNYIFINRKALNLSPAEFEQVIRHERSHIRQKHTLDNLFMELAMVICWFNPLLRIMKKELNNVHEFYADQYATEHIGDVANYSSLILKLSKKKDSSTPFLSHQFSMNNIKTRIIMLNKQKNPNKIALRYLAIVPCLAMLLIMFSFTRKAPLNPEGTYQNDLSQKIGNISWNGNSLYTDAYLTDFLGVQKGEQYNEEVINQKLIYRADGRDLSSLYMDQGYLFFTVELKKVETDDKIDLTFEITEGQVMKIGKVLVSGNEEIETKEILKMIELKEGDLFSRSKLIASQRNIIASRQFNPEKVIPTPIPNPQDGTVDIEFEVTEY